MSELLALVAIVVSITTLLATIALWAYIIRLRKIINKQHRLLVAVSKRIGLVVKAFRIIVSTSRSEKKLKEIAKRPRRRYIAFIILTEDGRPPPPKTIEDAVRESLEKLAGRVMIAESSFALAYYDPSRGVGIFRATNKSKHAVIAAMAFVRRIGGKRVMLIPLRTSGTIKRAKRTLQQLR